MSVPVRGAILAAYAHCGPACWQPVQCPGCGSPLPPRGRAMPPEMGIMDCCDNARMSSGINPRHLWSEEETWDVPGDGEEADR